MVGEEHVNYRGLYRVYDEGVIEKSSEEDVAWAPVVNLLQANIHLKDLVYDCQSQFPPSLLRALHEQHPQCRLHHLTFRFRTLLWGVPFPYEMELATSPSLYRVTIPCALRDSDYDDDFNLEAMMELTAGLAPNLKEVIILNLKPQDCSRSSRPRGSWQGLPGFTAGKVGSLTSLSLKGDSRLSSPTMLQNWARYTDFSCLKHLTLGGWCGADEYALGGETVEWVAQNHSFPRVKTLRIYLTRDYLHHARPHYSEHAVSFFQAFESLEELSVDWPIDSRILDSVLSYHGQTLKKLSLHSLHPLEENRRVDRDRRDIPFEFTKDCIIQIGAQCPVLEELAIPVKRNQSSASEAEMYRCFGRMKSLRFLFLILDCSNFRVTRDSTYNPEFDEEDQKPLADTVPFLCLKRGELKATFINCAVDEALARSIWKTISQNKTGRRLERLKLWPTGGGKYGCKTRNGVTWTILYMVQNMARSWILERVLRDDEEEGFTVRELEKHRRMASDKDNVRFLSDFHDSEVWEVFRSIWPPKEGSKDWRDDWSSFPLQI
ncbi:kinase subdomain-containing protein [Rutstroemia sp. NJR-2017a WRK4]|nr:kinase subdomain-containing protein [Rutstroemia sp. NJR-2017a WRK4]